MWDWENEKPLLLKLVEKQYNLGLEWIKEGKIEEIIFLGSVWLI